MKGLHGHDPIKPCFGNDLRNERNTTWNLGDSRNGYESTDQSNTFSWEKDRVHHIEQRKEVNVMHRYLQLHTRPNAFISYV